MSTTDGSIAPNTPEGGSKEKAKPAPPPETLTEFLKIRSCSAKRYLQAQSKRPNVSSEESERAREFADTHPEQIDRIVELARAATEFVPKPGQLLRWCEDFVRSRDDALREWGRNPSQDARAVFGELLVWAAPKLSAKAKKEDRQLADFTVQIGLCTLVARRSLNPLDTLHLLAEFSGEIADKTAETSIERSATMQITRSSYRQLLELARITTLSKQEIAVATNARNAAVLQSEELRLQNVASEKKIEEMRGEVASLKEQLNSRDRQNETLSATLEGTQTHAIQDLRRLRARFLRLVEDRLSGLLNDAWDALDTHPPHPDVALERIVSARDIIQKEIEWLGQSSD